MIRPGISSVDFFRGLAVVAVVMSSSYDDTARVRTDPVRLLRAGLHPFRADSCRCNYGCNLYLWYAVFVLAIEDWLGSGWAGTMVYLVAAFAAGALFTKGVEEQLLKLRDRRMPR